MGARIVRKIVTGGQTGVDRAALDAALACGISVGGWCPRGRRAEDGVIAARYPLTETPSPDYAERTAWNVRDSDGTLVFSGGAVSPGTQLTLNAAQAQGRPVRVVDLDADPDHRAVLAWIADNEIRVLNVAGPREREAPGSYDAVRAYLERLFYA